MSCYKRFYWQGGICMYVATRGLFKMKPPTIIVPKSIKATVEKLFEVHRELDGSELNHQLIGMDVGTLFLRFYDFMDRCVIVLLKSQFTYTGIWVSATFFIWVRVICRSVKSSTWARTSLWRHSKHIMLYQVRLFPPTMPQTVVIQTLWLLQYLGRLMSFFLNLMVLSLYKFGFCKNVSERAWKLDLPLMLRFSSTFLYN